MVMELLVESGRIDGTIVYRTSCTVGLGLTERVIIELLVESGRIDGTNDC